MKDEICKAFCGGVQVRKVPAGLAVSTSFVDSHGDRVGLFVVREEGASLVREDGTLLGWLEAGGFNRKAPSRAKALQELMGEYGVDLDEDGRTFGILVPSDSAVPAAALRFVAFLLRAKDLTLLVEHRVASTFREDAERVLREVIGASATLEERVPLSADLAEFPPDYLVRFPRGAHVGVFLGTTDARVLEALFVHMRVMHETHDPVMISVLMERGGVITPRVHQQAVNRLSAVAEFRGDELAAVRRVLGPSLTGSESLH